jgi:Spy/CpxP family protein refolding chaperone
MKYIIHAAALLACAAAFTLPPAASAQTRTASISSEHDKGPLSKLDLTHAQKAKIKGFIIAANQADENATASQRHANDEKLHRKIFDILTPLQRKQFNAELTKASPRQRLLQQYCVITPTGMRCHGHPQPVPQ